MDEAISAEKSDKDGKHAYQKGDYLEAAKLFDLARQAYEARNDKLHAAEMANNASVAYLKADDALSALEIVDGTAEIFAEANDIRREGMALGNRAAALEALKKDIEAMTLYEQSAELLKQAGEDQLRASVMQSLSMLQFRNGRQLQALATMQNGLEEVKRPSPKQSMIKKMLSYPIHMATRNRSS
jgi:tetratricopeptide (TPR) repeat protein